MQLNQDALQRATEALVPLGNALGTTLTPEPDGQCALRFDGPIDVILSAEPEAELFVLRSPVLITATAGEAQLRKALTMNAMELPLGYFLGVDPHAEELRLMRFTPYAEAEILPGIVAEILDMVPRLRLEFGDAAISAAASPAPASVPPMSLPVFTIRG